ncbi:hypothetical protein PMAYCL1PPCAC_13007 [Pristionchus mayeri]|uniref:Uncharacterized protein n=1 Tax=Pristionchus mayeri TaxID=1317129 RepID=A0AAN5CG35_9BILA|nr:hypothetical protein PMAYCL1PPCAC_13007 [Pristionchus mayeri]
MDLWGCAFGEDDLFCRKVGGGTHILDDLVERSLNGSPASDQLQLDEVNALPKADSPASSVENIEVIPCEGAAAAVKGRRSAPKILKKKSSSSVKKEATFKNLKKVTFEIEKMVAEEAYEGADRDDARARLAIRLGATPQPGKCLNYKQLKEDRAKEVADKALLAVNGNLVKAISLTKSKSKKSGVKKGKIAKKDRD